MTFKFSAKACRMGRISNNLEKHGDDDVIAFDIPITGILTKSQLNELGGEYSDRALFNTRKDVEEPVEIFTKCNPLAYIDCFEGATAEVTLSGKQDLEYKGAKISKITLEPKVGGMVEIRFSLRVLPNGQKECYALLEHQNREIGLHITRGKVSTKKSARQQELGLDAPPENGEPKTPGELFEKKGGNGKRVEDRPN